MHNINAVKFEVNGIAYEITRTTPPLEVAVTSKPSSGPYNGDIEIPESVTYGTKTYMVSSIGNSAFYNCENLLSVKLPETLQSINSSAFHSCTKLDSIIIPNSVTKIDSHAFSYCNGLKSIQLSNSLSELSYNVLVGCTSLASLTIPASVKTISEGALLYCSAIKIIQSLAVTPPTISDLIASEYALGGISTTIPLVVPEEAIANYRAAKHWGGFTNTYALNKVFSVAERRYAITSTTSPLTAEIICGETNYSGDFTLSASVVYNDQTYSITRVANGAFADCGELVSVNLPNSVTEIGKVAFKNCTKLQRINLSQHITTIGTAAFHSCKILTGVVFPNTLSSIGDDAFRNCYELTTVHLPDAVKKINPGTFSSCTKINSLIIGNQVNEIGYLAFSDCRSIKTLQLPDSLKTIGYYAFGGCTGIYTLRLPSQVTTIENNVFNGCSNLGSVFCSATAPPVINQNTFQNIPKTTPVYVPNESLERYKQAEGWKLFTNIFDVSGVFEANGIRYHHISNNPPHKVEVVKNDQPYSGIIIIPTNIYHNDKLCIVSSILDGVFTQNKSLTAIALGDSIRKINNNLFNGCSALTTVLTGNSLDSIGDNAFYNCSLIKRITIPGYVNYIGNSSFRGCRALTSISLGNSLQEIGAYAFSESGLKSFTVPDSVKVIRENAFEFCSGLSTVNFNKELREISNKAFYYCQALKSVTLPEKLNKIGESVFYDCASLTSVYIPNQVQRIEAETFNMCRKLASVTFGNGLKYIGRSAFSQCTSLTSLVLPAFIDTIGSSGFNYCTNINIITCNAENPPVLQYNALSGFSYDIPVYVSFSSIDAYKADVNWKAFKNLQPATILDGINYKITSDKMPYTVEVTKYSSKSTGDLVIPANVKFNNINFAVTSIGEMAFEGYSGIKSVRIPNSVRYIGAGAFRSCTQLMDITMSDSITRICYEAFNNTAWYKSISEMAYLGNALIKCKVGMIGTPYLADISNRTRLIADQAFSWCFRLSSVTLPASLKYIGDNAFYACGNLSAITCHATTPPQLGESVFLGVNPAIPLTVPDKSVEMYKQQPQWQDFFPTDVETGTSVQLKIYPVPAKEYLFVDGLNMGNDIVITNTIGKIIFRIKGTNQREKLDLTSLDNGLYLLSVYEKSALRKSILFTKEM